MHRKTIQFHLIIMLRLCILFSMCVFALFIYVFIALSFEITEMSDVAIGTVGSVTVAVTTMMTKVVNLLISRCAKAK